MEQNCPTASQNHEFLSLPDHFQEIKTFLDQKVAFYNSPTFINYDPVSIPHMFSKKEDIEISGFLAAMLAWGNRKTIIQSAKKLMNLMDNSPYDFIINFTEFDLKYFGKFVHRTFNGDDCLFFCGHYKTSIIPIVGLKMLLLPATKIQMKRYFTLL